jgi:mono/diheme cytochrome c family protein
MLQFNWPHAARARKVHRLGFAFGGKSAIALQQSPGTVTWNGAAVMRAVAMIGLWAVVGAAPALALDNLSEGKTVQQLFASDCAICHKDGKTLGAPMRQGQLASFLAQHYTTSKSQAAALAGYLTAASAPEPARGRRPQRTRAKKQDKPSAN